MTIKVIHIHKTDEGGYDMVHLYNKLSKKLNFIIEKLNEMATKQERFDAILTSLNETTNEIAADYQALLDEVRNGTVSEASLAAAEQNITRLKEIAASNDQPVPGETIPPATEA